jgi:hypothetical protein
VAQVLVELGELRELLMDQNEMWGLPPSFDALHSLEVSQRGQRLGELRYAGRSRS